MIKQRIYVKFLDDLHPEPLKKLSKCSPAPSAPILHVPQTYFVKTSIKRIQLVTNCCVENFAHLLTFTDIHMHTRSKCSGQIFHTFTALIKEHKKALILVKAFRRISVGNIKENNLDFFYLKPQVHKKVKAVKKVISIIKIYNIVLSNVNHNF